MDQNRVMTITNENGEEVEAYIIFTTKLEKYNKNYVFFFIPSQNDLQVSVASFTQTENGEGALSAVESDEEYADLEEVYAQFVEENKKYIDELSEGNFDNAESSCCGCGGGCGNCGENCEGDCSEEEGCSGCCCNK